MELSPPSITEIYNSYQDLYVAVNTHASTEGYAVTTKQHLWKLVKIFHVDYPDKPIATSPFVNSAPPIGRPTVKPKAKAKPKAATTATIIKQKRGQLAKTANTNKCAKKN